MPTSVSVIQPSFDVLKPVLKPVHTIEDDSVKGAFETAKLPPICRGGFEINCCLATNRRTVGTFHAKPTHGAPLWALPESLSDVSNPSIAKYGCEGFGSGLCLLQSRSYSQGTEAAKENGLFPYALCVLGTAAQQLSFPLYSCPVPLIDLREQL